MKVVAYFAVSSDGYIAGAREDVSWVSKESWDNYRALVSDARLAVVGRKTYEEMESDEFIEECRYMVLTSKSDVSDKQADIELTSSPRDALTKAKARGHVCAVVIGGAKTFITLMQDRLIDELYLDVEPILLGGGVRLFEGHFVHMHLIDSRILNNKKTVQLHYQITKHG